MITDTINGILFNTSEVTGYVEANIFQDVASQDDLRAYITIHLIDVTPERYKGGISMDVSRVQVNVYNENKGYCDFTADAVRTALEQFRDITNYKDRIDKILFDGATSAEFDEILRVYSIFMDFLVRSHQL